jgi:hypothetical protein
MPLYLSRVPADHPALSGQRALRDRAILHRRVMSLFGDLGRDARSRERGQVLFRVDGATGGLLVQSGVEPIDPGVLTRDVSHLADLPTGLTVQGTVAVNAAVTKNRTLDGSVRRIREPVSIDAVPAWLSERLSGAQVTAIVDATRETCRHGNAPLVLDTITFHAVVTDGLAFGLVLANGVGRGRAYGGGLVTVARR